MLVNLRLDRCCIRLLPRPRAIKSISPLCFRRSDLVSQPHAGTHTSGKLMQSTMVYRAIIGIYVANLSFWKQTTGTWYGSSRLTRPLSCAGELSYRAMISRFDISLVPRTKWPWQIASICTYYERLGNIKKGPICSTTCGTFDRTQHVWN